MRMIDADVLRDNLQALAYDDWNQGVATSWADAYSEVADMVEEMPTIERKTGKWIMGKCDQCGPHAPFWPMASTYYESDYCPNCGSEMRGDDHEND